MDKKLISAAFTLTGTIIGAGILGLPYVFSRSGFLVGVLWLLILGFILMYVNLCLGEVTLRTKQKHQLPGLAEHYLGKIGKRVMLFAVLFGVYSALLAYLIGEGQSLSHIFFNTTDYALYFAFGFWLLMTLLLREGLKGLKKVESYGVIAVLFLIFLIFVVFAPGIQKENLVFINTTNLFLPLGVVLFAFLGFTSIPELEMELKGNEKSLKKAIIIGSAIPIIVYLIFTLVFVGVLGNSVQEVATLSFGKLVNVLGIFTMFNSYFVLSFCLKDMFRFDLRITKFRNFLFVSVFPIAIYFLIYYFNLFDFIGILGIGGVVSGGVSGVLILLMNIKAKKTGDRKPEYKMWNTWWIIAFLSGVFITGIIFELFF
ncbi:MAG: aromatic amino acid transport family protein [Candidatus Pacearchaeota archaeon]